MTRYDPFAIRGHEPRRLGAAFFMISLVRLFTTRFALSQAFYERDLQHDRAEFRFRSGLGRNACWCLIQRISKAQQRPER